MDTPILIIGAGAIGSLVGWRLATAGRPVILVSRPAAVDAIRRQGLRLVRAGQTQVAPPVQAVASLAEAFSLGPRPQFAILTVKSYDTAQAAAELAAAAPVPLPVLSLQNGVGNEDTLAAVLSLPLVTAGVITSPATILEPGLVASERSSDRVGLADVSADGVLPAAQIAQVLSEAGFAVRTFPDWRSLKWTKLVMNLLCNASCALLGWSPELVWADRRLAALEVAAWQEAMTVLRQLGGRLVNLGGYPLGLLEPLLRTAPASLLQRPLYRFIVAGRGGKMPSLYLDLAAGRQRSEVDWLNGAVVAAGARASLPTPANAVLAESLRHVLSGAEPWNRYRDQPAALLARYQQAPM